MQNKKVIIKKHKAVKLPDINKPKRKSAWFKIFSGLACVIAIGVAIFIAVTEISIHSDTGNVYHITTSNPSISKQGDVNTSKIILWRGTNKDDTDHLKYTPDSNLVVINDGIISISKEATVDVTTTVEIEGNIRGREISTKIDVLPEAISDHDYHITTSSPYLLLEDPTADSCTLTTKDGNNIVPGVSYECHKDIRFEDKYTPVTINGNTATIVEGIDEQAFFDVTIYAALRGTIIGSITVGCFTRLAIYTPDTYEYVTTETIGSLQIDNFNDNITVSVEPHNSINMSSVQVVCMEDAGLPASASKAVRITRVDNKWKVRFADDTTLIGNSVIHLIAGDIAWDNSVHFSYIEVKIRPDNTKDTYAATAAPNFLCGNEIDGNNECQLTTTLNGNVFTDVEYALDSTQTSDDNNYSIYIEITGSKISLSSVESYEEGAIVDLIIDVWPASPALSTDSLPLTHLLITLIPIFE